MSERGYSRDATQCCVKIKELRQGYQKTKEANGRSGSHPQTSRFYEALHSILGAAATTTPPLTVDSEDGILSTAGSSDMLGDGEDEEGDEEDEAVGSAHNADFPDSQDLFITLTEIPYQPSPAVTPDTESGEGSATTSATVSQPSLASHSQRLAQIRRRKKRTREDMFSELMACSRAQAAQQTQWRENLSQMHQANMDWEERWRQEDQQATQTLLGLLREQRPSGPSHQAPAPWPHPAIPPLHCEPAARTAAGLFLDHAKETSVHVHAPHPSHPHPCIPPRHEVLGLPTTSGGTPVGQPIFHPGPEARWGY
ncbi:uncharacterized protein LOC135973872 [Chrysemys picta bellii]|uniref:uncharacterized protein LOC135973872 n=1 Tax=Chrysemys picta bellii TaxID=8478 RepID=UPI0032B2B112